MALLNRGFILLCSSLLDDRRNRLWSSFAELPQHGTSVPCAVPSQTVQMQGTQGVSSYDILLRRCLAVTSDW